MADAAWKDGRYDEQPWWGLRAANKDLYFPPEDNAWEVERMPDAELRVIPGVWGHFAGGGEKPGGHCLYRLGLKDLLADRAGQGPGVIVRRYFFPGPEGYGPNSFLELSNAITQALAPRA